MRNRKIHLQGLSNTLCGVKTWPNTHVLIPQAEIATYFKDVTCERCKKSIQYKQYLSGKLKEKPQK
jgi:hypothetical protein